jgi:exopolysaccharide biosynthesis predicted pyruvyltransferase EpsI
MDANNKTTLKNVFLRINSEALFVEPGGNWGDSLICAGAECLAEQTGLSYTKISRRDFFAYDGELPDTIYMHGCGGLNKWGGGVAWDLLERIIESPIKHAIIGPQTLVNDKDFVSQMMSGILRKKKCEKITFFVREGLSHKLMSELALPGITLHLDEDTAFHADLTKYISPQELQEEKYDLYVVREDIEQPEKFLKEIPRNAVITDPAKSAKSFVHWLRIHAHSKRVIANRTHSVIVSALMGKDTTMYSGSYHKNASIYKQSLESRGVKWLPPEEMADSETRRIRWPTLESALPLFIANSYKVKYLYRELKEFPNYLHGMPRK